MLFVESLGPAPAAAAPGATCDGSSRRAAARARRPTTGAATGLDVLSPLVLPLHARPRGAGAQRAAAAARWSGARAGRLRLRSARSCGPTSRRPRCCSTRWSPQLVVYHCVDDIAAQEGVDAASFRAAERRFAARADLVLASAPALAERMRALNDNVLYAPNVADTAAFATALDDGPIDPALAALPAPRIVFTGAIAAKKLDSA